MSLSAGTRLGPCEILSALGAGGMGEVYRARDTKLGRDVALKILPASFTNDPERVARFRREAQVLASLNHPHIAQIHGLDEANGTQFLVLELVDGESLDSRIARGPVPLEDALGIAQQIAEALEAAHDKGIIHRDLKPANIALTLEGQVKVLDFGLAKAIESTAGSFEVANSPTITSPAMMSGLGVILGTAAYMSPEQAKGRAADRRSDIWAFGCVLYEMLTGKRAFEGHDVGEVMAAVIRGEVKEAALPSDTPPTVRQLLRRCLRKDPRERLPHIGIARLDLTERPTSPEFIGRGGLRPLERGVWILALIAAVASAAVIAARWRPTTARKEPLRFELPADSMPDRMSLAISPDGKSVAYAASATKGSVISLRSLRDGSTRTIPTNGGATDLVWSPDNASLAFVSTDGSQLKIVDIAGGASQVRMSGVRGRCAWSRKGVLLCSNTAGVLQVVPATGGKEPSRALYAEPETSGFFDAWPSFLDDDDRFLFVRRPRGIPSMELRLGSLRSGTSRRLMAAEAMVVYRNNHLLFLRGGSLLAQPFDVEGLETRGEAVVLASSVAVNFTNGRAAFDVSEEGTVIYAASANDQEWRLNWVGRRGELLAAITPPGRDIGPALSPDSTRVAFWRLDQRGGGDVWIEDASGSNLSRLTFDPLEQNAAPVWSPDGSTIAFKSLRGKEWGIYQKPANGTGAEILLNASAETLTPMSWSRDGRFLLFMVNSIKAGWDIWAYSFGERKAFPVLSKPYNEGHPQFSPDGRWFAYNANESGVNQIFVESFPPGHGKWQISSNGGMFARWRQDGRELLFFENPGNIGIGEHQTLMSVDVTPSGPALVFSTPHPLFETTYVGGPFPGHPGNYLPWTMNKDASRFLLAQPTRPSTAPDRISVIVNWSEELNAREPTK